MSNVARVAGSWTRAAGSAAAGGLSDVPRPNGETGERAVRLSVATTVTRRRFLVLSAATAAVATVLKSSVSQHDFAAADLATLTQLGELAILSTLGPRFVDSPSRVHIATSTSRLRSIVVDFDRGDADRVALGARWFRRHTRLDNLGSFLESAAAIRELPPGVRSNLDAAAATAIHATGTRFSMYPEPAIGRLWIDGLTEQGARHAMSA